VAEEDELNAVFFDKTFLKKVKQFLLKTTGYSIPSISDAERLPGYPVFKQWHKALNLCVKERRTHEKINTCFIGHISLHCRTGTA
jgi:hypothetical protein